MRKETTGDLFRDLIEEKTKSSYTNNRALPIKKGIRTAY